jgi:predicted RNA binding protein YcfA (HicA-like mRNA interferase family)
MSEKLPRVTAADAIKVLERAGFSFSRGKAGGQIFILNIGLVSNE